MFAGGGRCVWVGLVAVVEPRVPPSGGVEALRNGTVCRFSRNSSQWCLSLFSWFGWFVVFAGGEQRAGGGYFLAFCCPGFFYR